MKRVIPPLGCKTPVDKYILSLTLSVSNYAALIKHARTQYLPGIAVIPRGKVLQVSVLHSIVYTFWVECRKIQLHLTGSLFLPSLLTCTCKHIGQLKGHNVGNRYARVRRHTPTEVGVALDLPEQALGGAMGLVLPKHLRSVC